MHIYLKNIPAKFQDENSGLFWKDSHKNKNKKTRKKNKKKKKTNNISEYYVDWQ